MDSTTILPKEKYPAGLKEIHDPPKKLFLRGAPPDPDAVFLTVVGSRNFTSYGKDACEKLIHETSEGLSPQAGELIIVSGLALGIDAVVHKAALSAGVRTLAIPGSGLSPEVLYPASNRSLAEKIVAQGGALLSEFEPDLRATPYSFPRRNRIMAGMARGVLVIEAAERSGTLITARLALEYNRDLFAVPGPIFSRTASGVNRLIREGAVPVMNGSDILSHWNIAKKEPDGSTGAASRAIDDCSDDEKRILAALKEPIAKNDLLDKLNIPIHEANILLSALELKGLIKETMGELRINM